MFFATLSLPISICAHLIFLILTYKSTPNWHPYVKLAIYYSLLSLSIVGIKYSYNMAYQVIDCGVFCIGDIPGTADANTGGDVFIGMIYFSVLLALVVFDVLLIINTHMSTYRYTTSELKRPVLSNDEQNNTSDSVSRKHIRDSDDFVVGQNSVSQVIRYNFHIMLAFLVFFAS